MVYNEQEYTKLDKKRQILFSEQYSVRYKRKNGEFWITSEEFYYAASKNKSEQVRSKFKLEHPDWVVINIIYQ